MEDLNQRRFTIRQARAIAGLSQEEMAKELGMTVRSYTKYENYNAIFRMDKASKFLKVCGLQGANVIFFKE